METLQFTATFEGLTDSNPPQVRLRTVDERGGQVMRTFNSSVPVKDAAVLEKVKLASPGQTVRVTEVTNWDDEDLASEITAFEVVTEAVAAAA